MAGPRSCPKCSGIMQDSETPLIVEESEWDSKVAIKVVAYCCRSCGFIEFWKA